MLGVKLLPRARQGDVDDGRVQDVHEEPEDEAVATSHLYSKRESRGDSGIMHPSY